MELDKIVYDKDSLASALIEQWNNESDTFKAIYPSDTATALANVFAAYGAMLNYILVSAMANCYTDTAYSEMGVYQLAQTLGNTLHGNNSAQVQVLIEKENFKGIQTNIPKNTLFKIDDKRFFNPNEILFPAMVDKVANVVLMQGELITVNKLTNGISNERFYFSSDFKASHEYIKVKINGEEWSVADSFLEYDGNNVINKESLNVVVLKTDPDGRTYVKLGDGEFGALPPAQSMLTIEFVSNEGSAGNIGEIGTEGKLETSLVFADNYGKQDVLKLKITTTTTAYGGFDKQSLETLRQTSPYVFASGHRAIRRQDYNALLQNKCGYITSKAWGEYEQSNLVGAYDSLMMNMVYYTGIKSFQHYPYFNIDYITNSNEYSSGLFTEKGFYGSHTLRISNQKDEKSQIFIQDTSGKGILFINNDNQDPRDDLLKDWLKTEQQTGNGPIKSGYVMSLPDNCIAVAGSGYKVNDILVLNHTKGEIKIVVTAIDNTGKVQSIAFAIENGKELNIASEDWTAKYDSFTTSYDSLTPGQGIGLKVKIENTNVYRSPLIYTNDLTSSDGSEGIVQYHPISHARSDTNDTKYYQSLKSPSLLQPVQIILDYSFDDSEEILDKQSEAITAIKFKAAPANVGTFIGTFAMFGTNVSPMPSRDNVRNNEEWTVLINRTTLNNPRGNLNGDWTDWIPLSTFTQTMDNNHKPVFNKYKYYIIEFYSAEDDPLIEEPLITIGKLKLLYGSSSSVLYYNDNSKIYLNLPTKEKDNHTLLGNSSFPFYNYNLTAKNVTRENGYANGNILSYVYTNNNITLPFYIEVLDIDNGIFKYTLNNSQMLVGNVEINPESDLSLDTTPVYQVNDASILSKGTDYKVNDEFEVVGYTFDPTISSTGEIYNEENVLLGSIKNNIIYNDNDQEVGYVLGKNEINITKVNKTVFSNTNTDKVIGFVENSDNVAYKLSGKQQLGYVDAKGIVWENRIENSNPYKYLASVISSDVGFTKDTILPTTYKLSEDKTQIKITEVDASGTIVSATLTNMYFVSDLQTDLPDVLGFKIKSLTNSEAIIKVKVSTYEFLPKTYVLEVQGIKLNGTGFKVDEVCDIIGYEEITETSSGSHTIKKFFVSLSLNAIIPSLSVPEDTEDVPESVVLNNSYQLVPVMTVTVKDVDTSGTITDIECNPKESTYNFASSVLKTYDLDKNAATINIECVHEPYTYSGTQYGNLVESKEKVSLIDSAFNFKGLLHTSNGLVYNAEQTEILGYCDKDKLYTNLKGYHTLSDLSNNKLIGRITAVGDMGTVNSFVWIKDKLIGNKFERANYDTVTITEGAVGKKLILNMESISRSGVNGVSGSGGKLKIETQNNLSLDATFIGNRIDTQDIAKLDQPIIDKYNHFTTFLEFQQPEIVQTNIIATVSLNTTVVRTSPVIIQEIKNNIQKLFEITPDYIGKGIKLSDIYSKVMEVEGVKWCRIDYPTDNISVLEYDMLICNNINIVETKGEK